MSVFKLITAGDYDRNVVQLDLLNERTRRFRSQLGRLEPFLGFLALVAHDVRPEGVDLLHVGNSRRFKDFIPLRNVNSKFPQVFTADGLKSVIIPRLVSGKPRRFCRRLALLVIIYPSLLLGCQFAHALTVLSENG